MDSSKMRELDMDTVTKFNRTEPSLQKSSRQKRFRTMTKIWRINRWWQTKVFRTEERRNWLDLIELFQIFKRLGLCRVRIDELFTMDRNTKGSLSETEENSTHQEYHQAFFQIGWSIHLTCWISGQSMHLA